MLAILAKHVRVWDHFHAECRYRICERTFRMTREKSDGLKLSNWMKPVVCSTEFRFTTPLLKVIRFFPKYFLNNFVWSPSWVNLVSTIAFKSEAKAGLISIKTAKRVNFVWLRALSLIHRHSVRFTVVSRSPRKPCCSLSRVSRYCRSAARQQIRTSPESVDTQVFFVIPQQRFGCVKFPDCFEISTIKQSLYALKICPSFTQTVNRVAKPWYVRLLELRLAGIYLHVNEPRGHLRVDIFVSRTSDGCAQAGIGFMFSCHDSFHRLHLSGVLHNMFMQTCDEYSEVNKNRIKQDLYL